MVSRGPPTYYRARAHRENPFFPMGLSTPVCDSSGPSRTVKLKKKKI
jgi:hypothetical protein